jgi:hypothetical protein
MSSPESTAELRNLLVEGAKTSEHLLHRLEHDANPVEIVGLLEALALVDERRMRLLEDFRKRASSLRKREEERSIRQFVLRALDQIGVPQTTGFLEDYLYATELVEAKSRGMGALRRDEYRAWARLRDQPRVAYVAPCLDEEGRAVPRWMSRTDWPLERRLVVHDAEELWKVRRLLALVEAYQSSDPDSEALFVPLLDRYAHEVCDNQHEAAEGPAWFEAVAQAARDRRAELEPAVMTAQERLAEQFADGDELRRFWGVQK